MIYVLVPAVTNASTRSTCIKWIIRCLSQWILPPERIRARDERVEDGITAHADERGQQ
jgi:hypothetical protein